MTTTELISGFDPHFKTNSKIGADMVNASDTLGLTIWKNVDDQLLGKLGPTTLQTIRVDGEGYIFAPDAGRFKAVEIPKKRLEI